MNYRHAGQNKKIEYMSYVHSLEGNRALGIKFFEMASQQIANPYWFTWSLSDEELFRLKSSSSKFHDALEHLGYGSGSITVKGIAELMIDSSKVGIRKGVKNLVSNLTNKDFYRKISPNASVKNSVHWSAAFVTIALTLLEKSAEYDESRSLKELQRRGLLTDDDVG